MFIPGSEDINSGDAVYTNLSWVSHLNAFSTLPNSWFFVEEIYSKIQRKGRNYMIIIRLSNHCAYEKYINNPRFVPITASGL